MKKRVADILVETLLELGVNQNFCVVGGGAMHLNNAFAICEEFNTVFCHHEQSCAFAAEGYAKLTGKIATVSVTSGPGAANTINGVYSAWVDSTPMIVVAGHPRKDTTVNACGLDLRCRGVQELDIVPMVSGITKYAVLLENPYDVKKVVLTAYHAAMSGRKGPTWISVPLDIQAIVIEEKECSEFHDMEKNEIINDDIVMEVIETIRCARRPCILTGAGIRYANSMDDFYEFTKKMSIPIVGGALLSDTMPEDFPLYFGNSGNIGPRAGNYILQNSDCILVLGNSLSNRQTGYNLDGFAPNARIIMIDASKDEMYKPGLKVDVPVNYDLKIFLPKLTECITERIVACKSWIDYCNKIKQFFDGYDEPNFEGRQKVPAKLFWKVFREKISDNTVLALGNSNGVIGIYQYGLKKRQQRILTNYNAGSMGYDLPEAIGAAVGTNAPVICVTGDGSIMMNLQELQTIKYNGLAVKVVVFSNEGYGAIRQTCKNFFDGLYTGCDETSGVSFPSFKDVAATFGFGYLKCANCNELEQKIEDFLAFDSNVILEVAQLKDDPVSPKIMSKLRADGTFETPNFTDLSPFVTEEEQNYITELERSLENV